MSRRKRDALRWRAGNAEPKMRESPSGIGDAIMRTRFNCNREDEVGMMINLTAADGYLLSAYRADPAGTPRGGLVVAQEIFGVNSHIRSVCDGYAADGYRVIAPALFDRYEKGVDIGYAPADIARGRELKAKATTDAALSDVAAARDALAGSGKIGIVGYCWGGFIAWMSACRLSGFACAVPYYGGGLLEAGGETTALPRARSLRGTRRDDSGRRREKIRSRASGGAGTHLCGRSRLQLRSARLLRRTFREARARAHGAIPAATRRLNQRWQVQVISPRWPNA